MAALDIGRKRKFKEAPPVPIKTYRWEDVRREKRRGKYPYTYLYKNLLVDLDSIMDDDKKLLEAMETEEKKPAEEGEKKKKKVVRKVKKTTKDKDKEEEPTTMHVEKPKEITAEDTEKRTEEIILKTDTNVGEQSVNVKTEEVTTLPEEPSKEEAAEHLTLTTGSTRDFSTERQTSEDKEVETICTQSEKLKTRQQDSADDEMEIKYEPLIEEETIDKEDRTSMDLSPDAASKNTESEDTYTDSNIEQYLDKEEVSKSVSETSGFEPATSVSDAEFSHDRITPSKSETQASLEVPDLKRKHSESPGLTKSNLSLFEKMKNSKFKPPTFKIPKFKKLTFNKRGSKRLKHDPKDVRSAPAAAQTDVAVQKRKPESPVYIHIPLNPTPEDLERERQAAVRSKSSRRLGDTSDSSADRLNGSKDTNGTPARTTDATTSSGVSKWKSLQSKTDKKSPPFKKKGKIGGGKKGSPKSEKTDASVEKKTSPVTKKRGDSPVEYIYIPLKPPENETEEARIPVAQVEAVNTTLVSKQTVLEAAAKDEELRPADKPANELVTAIIQSKTAEKPEIEIKQLPKVVMKTEEAKPKGAIKKTTTDKGKKLKDTTTKLTKDIKKIASKLKGAQKKPKRGSSKKSSLKSAPKPGSEEKGTSPKRHSDSPVQYIHIPLKGPLPEGLSKSVDKVADDGKKEVQTFEAVNKSGDSHEVTEKVPKEAADAMKVEPTAKVEGFSKEETKMTVEKQPTTDEPMETEPISPTTTSRTKSGPAKSEMQQIETRVQVDEATKPSFMSKLKGFKPKTRKNSLPAMKKGIKQFTSKKLSPKSPKKEISASKGELPAVPVKRTDSPVQYIYIPLKPLEGEEELPARTDSRTAEDQRTVEASKVESLPQTEAADKKMGIHEITAEDTGARVTTTNGDASAAEQDTSKSKSKWKGFKSKTEKKSPPTTKKKTRKGSTSLEKKDDTSASAKRDSPPVEYIYIPLKPVEGEQETQKSEATEVKTIEDTEQADEKQTEIESLKLEQHSKEFESTPLKLEEKPKAFESKAIKLEENPKVDVVKQAESNLVDDKPGKVVERGEEPPKENIMTKLKGLKPKKGQAPKPGDKEKKESVGEQPPMVAQSSDASVEYIFIPLKPEGTAELDSESEESKELGQPAVKMDSKLEEPKKEIKEETVESSTLPQSPSTTKEPEKEQPKLEPTATATKSPAAPAEQPKRPRIQDNTEEARQIKEAVLKKWQGFKTKPLQKPAPLKRKDPKKTSPKSEKKPDARKKSMDQPPMVVRKSDSPVEYIYIPLNPTQEQLDFEREMEEKQQLLAPKPRTPLARTPQGTPQPAKKPTTEGDAAKETSAKRGAIKKEAADKGSKIKDTTAKLTEDIKKFASKLKDMQKKSKKPTFKAFKRGSKSGSKTMSPTASKKVTTPPDTRSPPSLAKRRGDSSVEYIYIPLNPTPAEEQAERERQQKRDIKSQASRPESSNDEKMTEGATDDEPRDVSTKPVIVEAIAKKGKRDSVASLKKTKEFGKKQLKTLKDAVRVSKDKRRESIAAEKTAAARRISRDSPESIFIPLKELERPKEQAKETIEDVPEETKPVEIKPKPDERPTKETAKEKVAVPEEPHYEPLTKEDEEDGLKTAIIASLKDGKPVSPEDPTLKSVPKMEDSPEMDKQMSFDSSKAKLTDDQRTDENVIYETIQIKGEPDAGMAVARQSVTVANVSVDGKSPESLRDDSNNWSKSADHEYEPVNPPPEIDASPVAAQTPLDAPHPVHTVTDPALAPPSPRTIDKYKDIEVIPQQLPDKRLLRIPLDKELVVPSAHVDDAISTDKSLTESFDLTDTPDSRRQLLQRVRGTPDISSRTDGISTSQVDSSALEHLPLKKEDRPKPAKMAEDQGPNIQEKIRHQAGKLKTKIKGIKRPSFTIPNPKASPKFRKGKFQRPKFQRPKFERPKFNMPAMPKMPAMPAMPKMPRMPDRPKMNLPSFSLPRPGRQRAAADDRHLSTTDSSKDSRRNIFDFRTYPRLFDRAKGKKTTKADNTTTSAESETPAPEFATVPRAAARKKGPVGSRWVHRFTDIEYADEDASATDARQMYNAELRSKDRGDSLERRMEADLRYELALAEAEADEEMREYERENQDISRHSQYAADEYADRWKHGSFRKRRPDESDEFDGAVRNGVDHDHPSPHDERSSVASSGHRGVIEEIDSDQFFLREKGISQDNIQVGLYLSSEIRDAFRQPVNALSQMHDVQPGYGSRDYELDASDLSLSRPSRPKRKHLKRTKRVKKTPHASQEHIPYDGESVNTEPEEWSRDENDYKTFPPARPRRHRKHKPLLADDDDEPMVDEAEMPVDDEVHLDLENLRSQEDLPGHVDHEPMANIIGYVDKGVDLNDEYNKYLRDEALMYENQLMQDIEQPEIVISADQKYEIAARDVDRYLEDVGRVSTPKPPTRRHKSLKSLTLSEHDSIMGEFNKDRVMQDILEQELNVYRIEHEYLEPTDDAPVAPIRRSRSRTISQVEDDRTSHGAESLVSECHEPPCVQDTRDSMGYAVIDKSQQREPPLPSAPRRRRSTKSSRSARSGDTKFFTVPRALNDTPPARPQRNYSTLGPNRPPRKRSELDLSQADEEKENIDITQYIEIEDDDHNRDLQSGEVISKMKGRPLPAPPRPPRKTRDRSKEALRDITQETNILSDALADEHGDDDAKLSDISPASPMEAVEEIEVSTQTDPLPEDFCCEEVVEEPTDRIVAPTRRKRSLYRDSSTPRRSVERPKTPIERSVSPNAMVIERKIHSPVHDDTVTHASLLVRPVPEYAPDSYVSKRFAADIPDIFAAVSASHSDYAPEDSEEGLEDELDKETEAAMKEEKVVPVVPIYSAVSKPPKGILDDLQVDEPAVIPAELLQQFSHAPMASIDSDTGLSSTVTLEQHDEVFEMPEKPQRRKSQAQIQSAAVKPEPPSPGPSSPLPPPPQVIERIIERQVPVCVTPGPDAEVEVLKAQRLQVTDLDVERLNVTELQAQKILVSEIDGVTLQISELSTKSGNLVLNGLEIPSGLIQEILERLQPASADQTAPTVEQVSTQTNGEDAQEHTETVTLAEPAASLEQVGTQTSLDQPEPVPVSTQTSLDEPEPVRTEPVSTQTSMDEPEPAPAPPVMEPVSTQTSMEEMESEDCNCPDLIPVAELPSTQETPPPTSSTLQIVQPVEIEESDEHLDFTPGQLMALQDEIDDIIVTACEHVNRDTAYMNEMLLDSLRFDLPEQFSPTMSDEIVIDLPGHVIIETEDPVTGEPIFMQHALDDRLPPEIREMIEQEMEIERQRRAEQQSVLFPAGSPHMVELVEIPEEEEEMEEEETTKRQQSESPLPEEDSEVPEEFKELKDAEATLVELLEKPEMEEKRLESTPSQDSAVPKQLQELKDEEAQLIELLAVKPEETQAQEQTTGEQSESAGTKKNSDEADTVKMKSEQQPADSVIPREFSDLKDEQEAIIVKLQKEIARTQELLKKEMHIEVEDKLERKLEAEVVRKEESLSQVAVPPAIPPLPKQHHSEPQPQEPTQQVPAKRDETPLTVDYSEQTESSSAQSHSTPARPPVPQQEPIQEDRPQAPMVHGEPCPMPYYPEYVHSVPPQSFYALRTTQPQDLSEEDIPVHHRRRRHHRHLSRSSSDEENRRAVSRRTRSGSTEPSIPQLTGQLTRAYMISVGRAFRQLANHLSTSVFGTPESKQQLQTALIVLLVLIAGLILISFGGGQTVHLHHWEFFNPPKEL